MSINAVFIGGPYDEKVLALPDDTILYEYRFAVLDEQPYSTYREKWSAETIYDILPKIATYKYKVGVANMAVYLFDKIE